MVCRITAVAHLDERSDAADGARRRAAEGDGESAWLLEQWRAGRLLLARVTVRARAQDPPSEPVCAEREIEGVWLERDEPPRVESQVADVAPSELPAICEELRGRGIALDDEQLVGSFLHVELDEPLRQALLAR